MTNKNREVVKLSKKILIACDGKGIGASIKSILEKEDYAVSITDSAKEFMGMLRNGSYDLGFINFFMPEMSGREIAEKIRSAKIENPKLIFMNVAHFGAKGEEELRKLGVSAYMYGTGNGDFKKFIKEII